MDEEGPYLVFMGYITQDSKEREVPSNYHLSSLVCTILKMLPVGYTGEEEMVKRY